MENQIQLFTNQLFGSVSVLEINGEPWFIGNEIASILGYQNTRDALAVHVDTEDKNTVAIHDGIPGNPNKVIVNESGLYSLIFGSKLPAAKQFKHWVTAEVLPTMRKIGFSRSMQVLQEENIKLKGMVEGYQNSNLASNIDRVEVIEMRNQIIDKLHTIPIGTPITQEMKQYLIQYDPNWEG